MTTANYAMRLAEESYFDTGATSSSSTGSVQLIGREELVIRANMRNPPARWSSNSLFFTAGPQQFNAHAELYRLLNTPPVYSSSELSEAEAAVQRLSSLETEEQKTDWAQALAADLIIHND